MSDTVDRVVVFMDYQNVHGWARRQFLPFGADPSEGHVFPLKIGGLLAERRRRESELMEVRVYRGRPNPERQPGAAAANDRQTAMWERSDQVTVIRRNLQYPSDYPAARASEKGIDVAIAVDMIRPGMSGYMDTAILFSSDNDIMPAVEVLRTMPQCHVEVVSWSGAHRVTLTPCARAVRIASTSLSVRRVEVVYLVPPTRQSAGHPTLQLPRKRGSSVEGDLVVDHAGACGDTIVECARRRVGFGRQPVHPR